ncbi:MOSC domain-containing protein [Arthrobacter zhaoguopingii]|uniref:MOSC domain-containing protein n=1 Tax=Arthrobacter zhaoguopingii TaxID=2681491 RepID=UPI00135A0EF2|nr:MOSC domain-containing protein [Arthrobacter zhaoguopingii]
MDLPAGEGLVESVSRSPEHKFSKSLCQSIILRAGLGVEGDAHAGSTVQHLSRVRADPAQPNLRQVHLIQAELFDELRDAGFQVGAADLGENITTRGLDLLRLPRGTIVRIGSEAVIEVTGLRNPCPQINRFQPRLLKAVLSKDDAGSVIRKAGIMGIVLNDGEVVAGDAVRVDLPEGPYRPLEPV